MPLRTIASRRRASHAGPIRRRLGGHHRGGGARSGAERPQLELLGPRPAQTKALAQRPRAGVRPWRARPSGPPVPAPRARLRRAEPQRVDASGSPAPRARRGRCPCTPADRPPFRRSTRGSRPSPRADRARARRAAARDPAQLGVEGLGLGAAHRATEARVPGDDRVGERGVDPGVGLRVERVVAVAVTVDALDPLVHLRTQRPIRTASSGSP